MSDREELPNNATPDAADASDNVGGMLKMKPVPDPLIVEPPSPPPSPVISPADPPRVEAVPPPAPPAPVRKGKRVNMDLMDVGFQDQRVGTPTSRISAAVPPPLPVSLSSGPGLREIVTIPEIEANSTACAC
eukprot:GHVN01070781.1.p2 GENE.GHVN01070781.1~~GHVN01070781.1.p2  ORF type:complete len:132 (-),score=19.15 GHVN01070781.1:914-1309(-)